MFKFTFNSHWPGQSPLFWHDWTEGRRRNEARTPEKYHMHVIRGDYLFGDIYLIGAVFILRIHLRVYCTSL